MLSEGQLMVLSLLQERAVKRPDDTWLSTWDLKIQLQLIRKDKWTSYDTAACFLTALKKRGLVEHHPGTHQSFWSLTPEGLKYTGRWNLQGDKLRRAGLKDALERWGSRPRPYLKLCIYDLRILFKSGFQLSGSLDYPVL